MQEGYIKDYRQELDSDIWIMPPLYHRVWQYLKYKVNHCENEIPMSDGSKFKVLPGQHLTSYRGIAKGIGWYEGKAWKEPNPKTIKKILEWLEKKSMIKQEHGQGNREYTLVTLVKWEVYQLENERGNTKVTARKHQSNTKVTPGKQLVDINNNDKNEENDNNEKNKDINSPAADLPNNPPVDNSKIDDTPYDGIMAYFNKVCGTRFLATSKDTRSLIKTLWDMKNDVGEKAYTLQDFKNVIDVKCEEWNHDPEPGQKDMRIYIRPSTLFAKTNFENYLNQSIKAREKPKTKEIEKVKSNSFSNYSGQRKYDIKDLRRNLGLRGG